jgi:AbrB family looped-hinge helix DNA binding protein
MNNFPIFYGKTPVGTKGQIVIPTEVRKAMNIKPGDKVIIISGPPHHERSITVFPEEEFNKFFKFFEEHFSKIKDVMLKEDLSIKNSRNGV